MTPVFIVCRDLLTPLAELVAWLERVGEEELHLVDNDSRYPPMVEYLRSTPHTVHFLGSNIGHTAPWRCGVVERVAGRDAPYIVSDADIVPAPSCPDDAIDYFFDLYGRYPDALKVGFGLEIRDLPEHYRLRGLVTEWERAWWRTEAEPGVYRADIDTTFALYRPLSVVDADDLDRTPVRAGLRTGDPYVARHTPWYWNPASLTAEQSFYVDHATTTTHWTRKLRESVWSA